MIIIMSVADPDIMKRGGLKYIELKNQLPTKNDDWDSSRNLLAGAAEAVYEWCGSRIADSRPGTVHAKGAAARGVWGHAPPGNFSILDALRSILVHFEAIFHNGKARVHTLLQICYATQNDRNRTPP